MQSKERVIPKTIQKVNKGDSFLKLNNYDYSDENLARVKNFLATGQISNVDWVDYKKAVFRRRFTPKKWEVRNDTLVYKPKDLEVVPTADISNTLLTLYQDPQIGIGMAIRSLYNKVIDKYLGIKRRVVEEFIKGQTPYQLTKQPTKVTNKPIITEFPNDRWQADLVDMSNVAEHNNNNLYILTVIDNFSKYVFATPLKDRTAKDVLDGLKKIIAEQAGGTIPKTLQTDNGPEFANHTLINWLKEKHIHFSRGATYQATSNALIENFNNILRRMIREGNIRTNSLNWVNGLPNYLYNRNHSKHSTTKHRPIDLWRQGREQLTKENTTPALQEASKNIKIKAKASLAKNKTGKLYVGDHVRIMLSAISSEVRKYYKEHRQKLLPVKYTSDIYIIRKVIDDQEFVKRRYIVEKDGEDVITEYKKASTPQRIQLFFGSQLQKVDKDSEKIINTQDIEKLNKIELEPKEQEQNTVIKHKEHQTRSKTKEQKEKKVQEPVEVKVHQTRSKANAPPDSKPIEDSPETKPPEKKVRAKPKPIEDSPVHRYQLRERKKVSYKV